MRHQIHGRKLGRTSAHRKAMFRNQLTAFFTHERIVTTVAKAKELRPLAERMVTIARTGTLPARRRVLKMVPDADIVKRLFDDIAPRFMGRNGGYTRIMRLGRRRGDGAELAILEFVDFELKAKDEGGSRKEKKASMMDRAKSMFGGGAKADEEKAEAAPAAEPEEATEPAAEEQPVEAASEEKPKKKRAPRKKKAEAEPEEAEKADE